MIANGGLGLILIGWCIQAYLVLGRKDRTLSPLLLGFYGAGLLLLIVGNLTAGDTVSVVVNSVIVLVVVITGVAAAAMGRKVSQ